jgi:hypothetical protein
MSWGEVVARSEGEGWVRGKDERNKRRRNKESGRRNNLLE